MRAITGGNAINVLTDPRLVELDWSIVDIIRDYAQVLCIQSLLPYGNLRNQLTAPVLRLHSASRLTDKLCL